MKNFLYKYAYICICALFIIALIFVTIVRQSLTNEFVIMVINYGFWYCFGLLSGYSLAIYILKKNG